MNIVSGVAAVALLVSATAQAAEDVGSNAGVGLVKWQGDLTWLRRSGTCRAWDPTNEHMIAKFRPSGLRQNGAYSYLTLFSQDRALGFRVAGRFVSTLKTAVAQDIGSTTGTWQPRVSFLTQSPSVLDETTQEVYVTGIISGFDFAAGCTMQFKATFLRDFRN